MAVPGVMNPNYGQGAENLGIYGSNPNPINQDKDKDIDIDIDRTPQPNQISQNSRNFENKPLLFYFMFHNINKYKLLIIKSKKNAKNQRTNLKAGKYCLETYHNPYYEPFYNTRAKYKYTFDNTLNLPDNIFDSLADKYKKSDYVQESSELIIKLLF